MGHPRSTQRRQSVIKSDEEALRHEIVATACAYGRYGYRRVTALLRNAGWRVNHKRVERIWRQEGLKVPKRQPKRRRLWLNDGSCIRLRPERRNHVWSYDFVAERTTDGRPLRMLNIMDEYTRECLRIHIGRQVKATDVIYELSELFIERGAPDYLRYRQRIRVYSRSDSGMAQAARRQDAVHRTRESLGKRVHRVIQRQAQRRATQRRDL